MFMSQEGIRQVTIRQAIDWLALGQEDLPTFFMEVGFFSHESSLEVVLSSYISGEGLASTSNWLHE